MNKETTAAEYAASMADFEPIEQVSEEIAFLKANSPSVRAAVNEFWTAFWQEISKRYA